MIPVCYCGNRGVFKGLLMSVISLAKNTSYPLDIIILSMDLTDVDERYKSFSSNQLDILNQTLKGYNPESCARQIDVGNLYRAELMGSKNQKNGYTPYAMLRLFLDELEDIPDKLVYLDIDTVATADINSLYSIDMTGYEFAAARDYMGRFWISYNYCNSGVMLLNMQYIRQSGLFKKCRKNIVKHKMIMPDQTSLNKLAESKMYLDDRYNEQRDRKSNTVIKHFCKGIRYIPFFHMYNIKQWDRAKVRKNLKIDWMEDIYLAYDEIAATNNLDD